MGTPGWKDLLTKVDGHSLSYDGSGNPLSYYNGKSYTMAWSEGRNLASLTTGGKTATYTYDMNGLRTKKTSLDGTWVKYFVGDGKILGETLYGTDNVWVYDMRYTFDESGEVCGISLWNKGDTAWTKYYFVKNLQGDVLAVYQYGSSFTKVAEYTYDSWGNVLTATGTLANINPFRYRSYYRDADTGFYYLQSRYYDPAIGRWISPEPNVYAGGFDESAGILGYNVYTYCANNPVNFFDPTGEFIISTLLICVVAGTVIGGTVGGFAGNAYANSRGYTGWDKTKCILTGIGIGGLAGGTAGYFAAPLVVSATGVAGISVTSAGISTVAAVGTSFGKLGTLIANNGQQIIDWGKTTWHGIQRMAERGVTQGMAEAWVKTGKALQQSGGKILYITQQGAVVVNKAGQIITAYTSQYFDANMWEVVKKLFGR